MCTVHVRYFIRIELLWSARVTTRAEWQQLSEDRILDAQAHLAPGVGRWSAAYYLLGYAVECGLKSCVIARIIAHPDIIYKDKKFSNDAWTHDFKELLRVAAIRADRDAEAGVNHAFYLHWQVANGWTEQSRYLQKTQAEAERLYLAVTDPVNGVMQWIRRRW
jgi:hypothetical protein